MQSKRSLGVVLLLVGLVVFAASMLADFIGYGGSDAFGWKQITGSVVGAIVLITGIILILVSKDT
jgi:hypothetical protein